ncbi:uncharacterized protein LOC143891741 [Tasmannia lanceolata]|uniref:uncharacterized protein LOC143891741 n=1 Tax=Tasmannia lanceolata TaxID=3420 RepID=UPI004063D4CE
MKLNSDACLKGEEAAIGGIIRDDASRIIASFAVKKEPKAIHSLEIDAILHGIFLARNHKATKLWIESDSDVAVNISHIWREANGAADLLSKHDCQVKGEDISNQCLPSELLIIVLSDANGTLYERL